MIYFTWLISLLWFVTIDYYDHHLDFLKIMNQHPVSKTRFKGFAGETEVQKKWEQILVSSWGWVVSPTIYTGFSDASDASRLPGGWEQPSWNRHQWIASFPKVVKYWPAKSHLQQTWGGCTSLFHTSTSTTLQELLCHLPDMARHMSFLFTFGSEK